jgi:hypothetical protein
MPEELAPVELRWPERKDATAYRVLGRDAEQGATVLDTGSLDEPRYLLSAPEISLHRPLRLRIDVQHADGEWTAYGPAFLLPAAAPDGDVHWLHWSDDDGAGTHRLLVYDYARHAAVLDEIVLGTRFPLARNLRTPGSELRWRARPWRGDHWGDAEWQAPPFELLISEPAPEQVRPPRGDPRLLLLFTVDTEGGLHQMRDPDPARTIDQLVFGDFGGGESLGVGLQMDLLEQFGFRGTFFVDVLLEYTFGREALERTIQAIAGRGHEVELHVHDMHFARSEDPEDRELAGALLMNASGEHIRRVLDRSVGLFTERVGRPPRAFRAGAYHVGDALLALLPEFGIAFDSSLNRFRHAQVSDWMMTRTQPFRVGPLLELPVSWQLRSDREGKLSTRLYAPNRTPGDALTTAPAPAGGDPLTAVYVSHSFSLMRKAPGGVAEIRRWRETTAKLDDQFSTRMANMPDNRLVFYEPCPDEGMVAHARAALERIAAREDATCVTFEELERMAAGWWRARDRPVDPVFVLQESEVRARLAGSRIYSGALLNRLTTACSAGHSPHAQSVDELGAVPIPWSGRTVLVTGTDRCEAIEWLQSRLATAVDGGEVPNAGDDQYDAIVWLSGFDQLRVSQQGEALARCLQRLVPGAPCVIGTSTLGLVDHDPSLPFAAELLFPSATLQRHRAAPAPSRAPWDVPTLVSLIQDAGFDMLDVRRRARADEELELLARHHDKLRWLDPEELSCDGVLLVAQRPVGPVRLTQRTDGGRWHTLPDRWTALAAGRRVVDCEAAGGAPLDGLHVAEGSVDVVIMSAGLAGCSPVEVEERFVAAYEALCPGGDLLARLDGIPVSDSSALVCAMRAGLEVVESSRVDGALEVRFVRPFEAAELDAL